MLYSILYVFTIVLVNRLFALTPLLHLPGGEVWSPVALLVGFIFIIRDYAQREIGHKILLATLIGGGISWHMANQEIALASMCAFIAGEMLDWAVYSITRRPFSQRMLLSSAISTPLDSAVFMLMIGIFSWPAVALMTASKLAGAVAVFFIARHRELTERNKVAT